MGPLPYLTFEVFPARRSSVTASGNGVNRLRGDSLPLGALPIPCCFWRPLPLEDTCSNYCAVSRIWQCLRCVFARVADFCCCWVPAPDYELGSFDAVRLCSFCSLYKSVSHHMWKSHKMYINSSCVWSLCFLTRACTALSELFSYLVSW